MTTGLLLLARALHYGAGMVLAGMVAFRWLFLLPAFACEPDKSWQEFAPLFAWLNRLFVGAGIVLVISGIGLFWAVAAGMSDTSLAESLTGETLGAVFFQTQFGSIFQWRIGFAVLMVILVIVLARTRWQERRRISALEIVAGIDAVALMDSLAWTGHAAATGGPTFALRVGADALHLFVTGIWPTGLLPFALFLSRARRSSDPALLVPLGRVVDRFSNVSLAIVVVLVATGCVNSYFIVGSFLALITTTYGCVLCTKLVLFAAILVVAAGNRYRVVPRLGSILSANSVADAGPLLRRLQYLVTLELALAIGIILVVSVLGMTPPPQ
jgi:putative copper resistance protein D